MTSCPEFDPASPLQFVINAVAGSGEADAKCKVIETPGEPGAACITAVMLRPIGTLAMLRLMLHGAMGTLGEAQSVERFDFNHMVVRPTLAPGRRGVKVAFDGEVTRMRGPLEFRVLAQQLYLLVPHPHHTEFTANGGGI
jgi:diacylglycerol kinase family enzyme